MKKIKWQFEGINTYFVSTEKNLTLDILTQAKQNGISLDHQIITISDDRTTTAISSTSDGVTTSDELATLPVDVKKTKARKTTVELSDVSGNLDDASSATDILEDAPDLSLLDGSSDRLAL